eukprot:m.44855 g.44855  ORF g.44855 m.44855 type:complete len:618 (-) comp8576_c0_seq1:857-2710(-)
MSGLQKFLAMGPTGTAAEWQAESAAAAPEYTHEGAAHILGLDNEDEMDEAPQGTDGAGPADTSASDVLEEAAMLAEVEESARRGKRKRETTPPPAADPLPTFIPLGTNESGASKRPRIEAPTRAPQTEKGWARAPWQKTPYAKEPGIALHEEVLQFTEYISANSCENRMRLEIVARINHVVKSLWPEAVVNVFGSFAAGICLPTSDIDIVVMGEWKQLPLRTLAQALDEAKVPMTMQVIEKTRVPIIKLRDAFTSIDVDISFNMEGGPAEAKRIRDYMDEFKPLRPLTLVIKQFLAQRGLNEVYTGGLGSYAIMLMVLSFLQMHPRPDVNSAKANLGVLLIEFLELYGCHFNYERVVISVRQGGRYLPKVGSWFQPHRASLLAIENPNSPADDVSRNSFGMDAIRRAFNHAYHILTSTFYQEDGGLSGRHLRDNPTQLSRIIKLPVEVVQYRKWVVENWPTNDSDTPSEAGLAATSVEPQSTLNRLDPAGIIRHYLDEAKKNRTEEDSKISSKANSTKSVKRKRKGSKGDGDNSPAITPVTAVKPLEVEEEHGRKSKKSSKKKASSKKGPTKNVAKQSHPKKSGSKKNSSKNDASKRKGMSKKNAPKKSRKDRGSKS